MDGTVPRCPHCRLTLRKADLVFGVAPKHFGLLADVARQLTPARHRKVEALLGLFGEKFPQSILSVYVTEVPKGAAVGEYAFWLANRVRSNTVESVGENNFDLVLVVDPNGGAALTAGYGLENHLTEEDLSAVLEAGRDAFVEREWADGIELCLAELTERMREASRRAKAE